MFEAPESIANVPVEGDDGSVCALSVNVSLPASTLIKSATVSPLTEKSTLAAFGFTLTVPAVTFVPL